MVRKKPPYLPSRPHWYAPGAVKELLFCCAAGARKGRFWHFLGHPHWSRQGSLALFPSEGSRRPASLSVAGAAGSVTVGGMGVMPSTSNVIRTARSWRRSGLKRLGPSILHLGHLTYQKVLLPIQAHRSPAARRRWSASTISGAPAITCAWQK